MLKPNDFRLGLWVHQKANRMIEKNPISGEEICAVETEDCDICLDYENLKFAIQNPDFFEGIPVTEKWFVNFGFETVNSFYYKKDIFTIGLLEDDIENKYYTVSIKEVLFIKIKFIHELQDLHKSLTGEEIAV